MAEIARRATQKGNRILFMVHRKEIVDQVRNTFEQQGVDMNLATIGMVQTITRKVDKLEEPSIIFVDESHHVKAKSYRRILDKFPKALKLMFTATPIRLNGEGFEDVADDLIEGKQIQELIDDGFLAPVDYYAPTYIDISKLKVKRTGEFDEDSIKKAFKPKIYGNAVSTYKKLADGKQAIAYTYNVESAKQLAAQFNAKGISAQSVDGKTSKDERNRIIEDYRNGKIQVLTNNELFTEGLDLPNVDCVIMLRPTQSLSLYLQFSMRSMNPRKDKRAVIIDHVGNVKRFGLPTDERHWSLKGTKGNKRETKGEVIQSTTTCEYCFGTFYRKGDSDICPYCGAKLESKKHDIEVVEDAKLEKISNDRKERIKKVLQSNVAGKSVKELNSVEELKEYAELYNYKKGWIYYQARNRGWIH